MSDDSSAELKLAEAVAERTAMRMRAGLREELDQREETQRRRWCEDLARLRDDLTTKGLLEELRGMTSPDTVELPVRVLVVDDYPEIRRAFVKIFTKAGMLVSEACDGPGAAAILDKDPLIEVVVADISMPKNGYTLLEHVRKYFPIIEVVMTSGYDLDADRTRKLGAFAFLPKPFNITQAVLLVERAAEFRRLKLATSSNG